MESIAEHVRELLDAGRDAVVIVDAHQTIVFANARMLRLFGYTSAELIGQRIEVLLPKVFRAAHPWILTADAAAAASTQTQNADLAWWARHRDGSEFPIEVHLSRLQTDDGVLLSSVIRDITDREHIHDRLLAARMETDRANRDNRAKSSFLAAASHNLRQPLQTLTLLNSVLEKTVRDPVAAKAVTAQRAALASVSSLLNALLDISKLESGAIRPDIEDCSVQAIFRHMKATFEAQAQAKGISLLVDESEHIIRTDKGLFEQIIQNLVANAIRYTRKGMVQLRCMHEAAFVRVEVLDTGIGIAANQRDAIFDEFYQLDGEAGESREGFGLGLAIVRRMTQLLGHSIEVSSEVGRGSCFAVTAPCGHNSALPASTRSASPVTPRNGKATVLVIDDDPAVAAATKLLLKLEGYRVQVAANIDEAIALNGSADAWPDLIVADYHLANGGSGIDAIGTLRTLSRRSIPAVLVTGDTSFEVPKALANLGGCEVLSKPFVPSKFLEVVSHLASAGPPTN